MSAEIRDDQAVVDRIEAGIAVLLVGPGGDQHQVPVDALPEGAAAGDVLNLEVSGDGLRAIEVDREASRQRADRAVTRLERIRRTRGSGRFGRD